jgi:hypothetical protein
MIPTTIDSTLTKACILVLSHTMEDRGKCQHTFLTIRKDAANDTTIIVAKV